MSAAAAQTLLTDNQLTWWQRPPDEKRNSALLYVIQVVPDALSSSQRLVLHAMCRHGRREKDNSWICAPGGYTAIAREAGLARKTVYSAIRDLKRKGIITEHSIIMRGRKREKTIWRIYPYRETLEKWRKDQALYHTALNRVVARGRRKLLITPAEAEALKVDGIRAPRRGSGRALSEQTIERITRRKAPASDPLPSDEDITTVYNKLLWANAKPNLKDAMDVIRAARREAERLAAGELPAEVIAQLVELIAREYKPSRENAHRYPVPRLAWYLAKLPGYVGQWVSHNRQPDPNARTG